MAEQANVPGSTLLHASVLTRWGSQVRMLESVVKNRVCVEQTLLRLRREKYSSDAFNALGWVWTPLHWSEAEHLLSVLKPVADYVELVEGNIFSCPKN